MTRIFYSTEPTLIGRHYWRVTVFENWEFAKDTDGVLIPDGKGSFEMQPGKGIRVEWRESPLKDDGFWNEDTEWPTYNLKLIGSGLPQPVLRMLAQKRQEIAFVATPVLGRIAS